jgi:hypothetical protein
VAAFERCPREFHLRYVTGTRAQFESAEARRGRALHDLLAFAVAPEAEPWPLLAAAALDFAPAADKNELARLIACVGDRYGDPPRLVPAGAANVAAEVAFGLDARGDLIDPGDPAAWFAGTIDLLRTEDGGRTVVVRDYKTGRAVARGPLEADPQLRVYAYASTRIVPRAGVVRLERHHLRFPTGLLAAEFAREEFADGFAEIAARSAPIGDAARRHERGASLDAAFPTRPGALCATCPVRIACPAWGAALALPGTTDLTDRARVAAFAVAWRQARQRVADAESVLRAYVEAEGPLDVGDEVLDLHPSSESEVDTPRAAAILIAAGVPRSDILAAMKMTRSALDALARGRATPDGRPLSRALAAAITTRPAVRFGWRERA